MARDPGRNFTRARIAYLAARLMAEDGIEDYALAKRKAARQAGIPDSRQLPNNDEIDAALQLHRELYQREHPLRLRELRQLALEVMDELLRFNPYLTGSVLRGSAGKYAGIHLQLFADNAKGVEHYLLDRNIEFRSSETRLYAGDMQLAAPVLSFSRDGVEVQLTLLSPRELRSQLKASAEGKPIERARRDAVKALLAAG
ncbi:MAG: hypothetical protein HY525_12520 [Betaproteobacteria bacterium]|nr:hypothetical protein [Betaproteobacteria bacterium]